MSSSVAILFVDIVGSTGLYERLGTAEAKGLVTASLNLLREEVVGHGGEVVQAIGDELMCRFPTADGACAAAIAMQQRIVWHDLDSAVPVKIRIGLQWGEALSEGNNLYGDAVNTAARLSHVARGAQIMTSERVISEARGTVGDRWREIGPLPLKGKEAPLVVCEILWETHDATGHIAATMIQRQPSSPHELRLAFGDTEISLGTQRRSVTLGRDQANDLVIPHPEVSRFHATIECRMDKFYLADHSTNGTTVIGPDREPLTLHREEAPLAGHGEILCGFAQKPEGGRPAVLFMTTGAAVSPCEDMGSSEPPCSP
jgi:class 3 adenylate cyclase